MNADWWRRFVESIGFARRKWASLNSASSWQHRKDRRTNQTINKNKKIKIIQPSDCLNVDNSFRQRKTTFNQGHLFDKEQCLTAYPVPASLYSYLLFLLLKWNKWWWIRNMYIEKKNCVFVSLCLWPFSLLFHLRFYFRIFAYYKLYTYNYSFSFHRYTAVAIYHTQVWSFVLFYWVNARSK